MRIKGTPARALSGVSPQQRFERIDRPVPALHYSADPLNPPKTQSLRERESWCSVSLSVTFLAPSTCRRFRAPLSQYIKTPLLYVPEKNLMRETQVIEISTANWRVRHRRRIEALEDACCVRLIITTIPDKSLGTLAHFCICLGNLFVHPPVPDSMLFIVMNSSWLVSNIVWWGGGFLFQ